MRRSAIRKKSLSAFGACHFILNSCNTLNSFMFAFVCGDPQ
jgi:hypothetical protein